MIPEIKRIELVYGSTLSKLKNESYLEHTLIPSLGLNTELLWQYPDDLRRFAGGMLIWQYPNQFAKYLVFLSSQRITSYLEIGIRWGGCFLTTLHYLKRFNSSIHATGVDLEIHPQLRGLAQSAELLSMDSHLEHFTAFCKGKSFDLVMIDGDHSYEGVKADFESVKDIGRIFVFHDITSSVCPGVGKFWGELKSQCTGTQHFIEFVDQYDSVVNRPLFGLGVYLKYGFVQRDQSNRGV
jgi:Cephalosporin hydroxylase